MLHFRVTDEAVKITKHDLNQLTNEFYLIPPLEMMTKILFWERNVIYSKDIETIAIFQAQKSFSEHNSGHIVCCNIFHFESWITSWTKCWRISICLVRLWKIEFFACFCALQFSLKSFNFVILLHPNTFNNVWRYISSFAASVRAIYSTSVEDNAAVGCFRNTQLTEHSPRINLNPVYALTNQAT